MAITLTTLKDRVLQLTNTTLDNPWGTTQLDAFANSAHKRMAGIMIEIDNSLLIKSATITRVVNTSAYSLTTYTDLYKIRTVLDSDGRQIPMQGPILDPDYSVEHWYKLGDSLYLFPDNSTDTVTMKYHYLPASFGTTATSVLPDFPGVEEAIGLHIASDLYLIDGNKKMSDAFYQRYYDTLALVTELLQSNATQGDTVAQDTVGYTAHGDLRNDL